MYDCDSYTKYKREVQRSKLYSGNFYFWNCFKYLLFVGCTPWYVLQVDSRILRAVAIENSKDADVAVGVVLSEIMPSLSVKSGKVATSPDQGPSLPNPYGGNVYTVVSFYNSWWIYYLCKVDLTSLIMCIDGNSNILM